ncbi:hypothetical protein BN134_713 [Cronobacter dublinensis 1210]|uniref:Uncharacterized protein n=1 Tax=Cronobacter dublinensis 1210 TaxID=1208656 RepID=A0ABM9Q3Q7_9ENTR|nr:hypothetical protein BN134_713 [Cronobacter dublinensis 1210]
MPLIKEKPSVKTEGLITLMDNKQRMTVLLIPTQSWLVAYR